jgi:N-acetylmuramic acid 6-phosphate etherase
LVDLSEFLTEKRNPNTYNIDELATFDILKKINDEDKMVPKIIESILPNLKEAVDCIVESFQEGGRLIYVGAGTSGRLGILDAVECVPTYGTPKEMVVGVLAGGAEGMGTAIEGAEDSKELAITDMTGLGITNHDVIVGIAASGRTPYTVAAMKYAKDLGASIIAVVCRPDSEMEEMSDICIVANVGAEVVTGSTRMKAGTAQKLILNMLSTASMIRLGKVYNNLMVSVIPTNEKLMQRAKNIIAEIAHVEQKEAELALKEYGSTNAAILSLVTGITGEEVRRLLDRNNGHLRKAIEEGMGKPNSSEFQSKK